MLEVPKDFVYDITPTPYGMSLSVRIKKVCSGHHKKDHNLPPVLVPVTSYFLGEPEAGVNQTLL